VEKPTISISKRLGGKYESAPQSPMMKSESKQFRIKHSRNNSKEITGTAAPIVRNNQDLDLPPLI